MKQSNWIDWEIEYSLKEITREDRTSRSNGIVGVIQKIIILVGMGGFLVQLQILMVASQEALMKVSYMRLSSRIVQTNKIPYMLA